jgi:cysteine-S-conjugate beta-lyase
MIHRRIEPKKFTVPSSQFPVMIGNWKLEPGNSFMKYDFDQIIDRRSSDSIKWRIYADDVLPMWVADMDFVSAAPVIEALRQRTEHGVFGYSRPSPALTRAIQKRLLTLYGWTVGEPEIVFLPGIVTGLNIAFQAFAAPGEAILAHPPVYFHFLRDPLQHGRVLLDPPLVQNGDSYEIDFDLFESSITQQTRLFVLCNPHNPVGRVYTKSELERTAAICLRHNLIICSDEIHCDLVYAPHRHLPIASLAPEIEDRTVTLMAPSKTYNVAGLECGYAVIKNSGLRNAWKDFSYGVIPGGNIMGHVAALAALTEGQDWLEQVLTYLQGNRDYLRNFLQEKIPSIRMNKVEATYLAWLDCRGTCIMQDPADFFLSRARVAMNDGTEFGKGGTGFVRLNFACSRQRLAQALEKMKSALEESEDRSQETGVRRQEPGVGMNSAGG